MNANVINIITNVIGFLLVVLVPVKNYLESQTFDWLSFSICVLGAVVAYFTGKSVIAERQK